MAADDPNVSQMLATSINQMSTMIGGMNLQGRLNNFPEFDGSNYPLKDFLQNIQNALPFVEQGRDAEFVASVLSRLRGEARACVQGEVINTTAELITVVKEG